ncbi:hypothetical protein [Marinibacterium sp. SX1]|uniref:hypothetical protein n=1 Tax=Marinibacterium sp. SX1 TaxID=3388424 RepID=UPI003D174F2E
MSRKDRRAVMPVALTGAERRWLRARARGRSLADSLRRLVEAALADPPIPAPDVPPPDPPAAAGASDPGRVAVRLEAPPVAGRPDPAPVAQPPDGALVPTFRDPTLGVAPPDPILAMTASDPTLGVAPSDPAPAAAASDPASDAPTRPLPLQLPRSTRVRLAELAAGRGVMPDTLVRLCLRAAMARDPGPGRRAPPDPAEPNDPTAPHDGV